MNTDRGPDSLDRSRRDFVKKAGKLAVYTPPVLISLMQPGLEAIAASSGAVEYPTSTDRRTSLRIKIKKFIKYLCG